MSKTPSLKHRLFVQFPALPYFWQKKNIGILIRNVFISIKVYLHAMGINEMFNSFKPSIASKSH